MSGEGKESMTRWGLRGALGLGIALLVAVVVGTPPAAALPDGRGYELVSPPDTGAVVPYAAAMGGGVDCFETNLVAADGDRVAFNSDQGSLPGLTSNGRLNLYEAHRTATGWETESKSATGAQTTRPTGGLCLSPDHQYSTLVTGEEPFDKGSLVLNGKETSYFRTPSGSYVLPGSGSIGTEQMANIKWIADGGVHIILTASKRLESAAPAGVGSFLSKEEKDPAVNAVYDRTPLGLQVVSLLPSGSAPNSSSETTFYRGASRDGGSVVFEVAKSGGEATLYEHRGSGPTASIVHEASQLEYRYGGISANGRRVAYLKVEAGKNPPRGSIYLFDAETGTSTPVTTGTGAALVNFSEDGSHVYFTSEESLAGSGPNPLGVEAQPGAPNLYVWDVGSEDIHFIATVAPADVEENVSVQENLTEWTRAVARPQQGQVDGRANATSRTTPDGSVFVFQAHGNATEYDSSGHSEIYRYDEPASELSCISCPQDGPSAATNAYLQQAAIGVISGLNALATIANVSADGRTVFFMTGEALAAGDVNQAVDVYEWREGDVSLISGGQGSLPSLLYGMSPDARDVFFLTTDRLVPQDESSVLSIYDARVGGGFAPPAPAEICEGDPCQGTPSSPVPPVSNETETPRVPPEQAKPHRHHRHHHRHKKRRSKHHRQQKGARK